MSEEKVNEGTDNELPLEDELTALKARATQMGITFHPSIGLEKVKEKINEVLQSQATKEPAPVEEAAPVVDATGKETGAAFRVRKKKEAAALVRIRVTCMNPNKRDYDGEIFTAGNSVVGTFRKYVPFDTEWHVPKIIFNMIKQRQCQIFVDKRDSHGVRTKEGKLIKEFAIEVLEPLTKEELKDLAQRQAMANGTAE